MTLRIEDGGRVYECVAQVCHKKKELVIVEAMQQTVLSLWSARKRVTEDEERELSHLRTIIRNCINLSKDLKKHK